MADAKAKIRKGTLFNRRLLADKIASERTLAVHQQLWDFIIENKITCSHVFLPIKRNQEFDTWELVKKLHQTGVAVVVSLSDFETMRMDHYLYETNTKFELNRFDIPEPVGAEKADVSKVQMILIPLLAADKVGNRIGYGKGFYDRLLAEMPQTVLKVGVNLAPLFDRFDFAEAHDVKLDYCITPHQTYKCHE